MYKGNIKPSHNTRLHELDTGRCTKERTVESSSTMDRKGLKEVLT
jgi:hypothetical protein